MATAPAYAATPKTAYCQVTTADTSRTAPTNQVTLHTAGANGGRMGGVLAVHTGTSTAGVIRIWLSNDGGTTKRLIAEILVTAITPSTSVAVWSGTWVPPGGILQLAANAVVYATTHNTETFNIHGLNVGDY